jgi:hypothetical protein
LVTDVSELLVTANVNSQKVEKLLIEDGLCVTENNKTKTTKLSTFRDAEAIMRLTACFQNRSLKFLHPT